MTITPAHSTQSTKTARDEGVITLRTSDITNLRCVLAECRTIKEIAGTVTVFSFCFTCSVFLNLLPDKSPPSPSTYEWLIPYTHTAKHGTDVEAYVSLLRKSPLIPDQMISTN